MTRTIFHIFVCFHNGVKANLRIFSVLNEVLFDHLMSVFDILSLPHDSPCCISLDAQDSLEKGMKHSINGLLTLNWKAIIAGRVPSSSLSSSFSSFCSFHFSFFQQALRLEFDRLHSRR